MVLADTNIWIDFFREGDTHFGLALWRGDVKTHWVVIGELSTGNLSKRSATLHELRALDRVEPATELESLALIENQKLHGKGLSWADVQLLASCLIHNVPLWTRDKRLREAAKKLHCSWD
jgi:predicted nucleic acid-binding protein